MRARHVVFASAIVAVGLSIGACSGDSAEPAGLYAADFAHARELASSDFEREVLADDEISDEELREARSRLKSCVEDAGYGLELDGPDEVILDPGSASIEAADAAMSECQQGTVLLVEGLYWAVRQNPQKADSMVLLAECLERADVVDESVTAEMVGGLLETPPVDQDDPGFTRYQDCLDDPNAVFDE